MNTRFMFFIGIILLAIFTGPFAAAEKRIGTNPGHPYVTSEIQPYVDFLKTQHTSPVDYVMELFDRYDVVIFGERAHPEMTQYDLIFIDYSRTSTGLTAPCP